MSQPEIRKFPSAQEASIAQSATKEPQAQSPALLPKRKQFTSSYKLPKLPADQAQRQGRITLLAWNALGREAALLFLNSHDDALGGRPLDLATATIGGFDAIACAIAARTPTITSA